VDCENALYKFTFDIYIDIQTGNLWIASLRLTEYSSFLVLFLICIFGESTCSC